MKNSCWMPISAVPCTATWPGVVVDDNSLAMSAFQQVTPGGHYLGSAHTMANYTTAFFDSTIADNTPFETWAEAGQTDSAQRANTRWKTALADYQPPPMDVAVDEALKDYIQRKKIHHARPVVLNPPHLTPATSLLIPHSYDSGPRPAAPALPAQTPAAEKPHHGQFP